MNSIDAFPTPTVGHRYLAGAGSNGPRPIWSRTVTTGALVSVRRCQFAPSTARVCPEMKRANGEARKVAAIGCQYANAGETHPPSSAGYYEHLVI